MAGVVVRDVAARDRMKKRLEELQAVKDPLDPKLLAYMPQTLLNAQIFSNPAAFAVSTVAKKSAARCARPISASSRSSVLWQLTDSRLKPILR